MEKVIKTAVNAEALAHLDLSNPDSVDLAEAAADLVKATEKCGFAYVQISDGYASTIEQVRRVQRSFFTLTSRQKSDVAIDINNRGYLAEGMAQMHGAVRKDKKEVFFWGREAIPVIPM